MRYWRGNHVRILCIRSFAEYYKDVIGADKLVRSSEVATYIRFRGQDPNIGILTKLTKIGPAWCRVHRKKTVLSPDVGEF